MLETELVLYALCDGAKPPYTRENLGVRARFNLYLESRENSIAQMHGTIKTLLTGVAPFWGFS